MSTELATRDDAALMTTLQNSIYPGAKPESIGMALSYCRAAKLDPLLKPVHIVPMWDSKAGAMRDVIMPGIGLYRTNAARTGEFAGQTEPEFGPDITDDIGGQPITYPEWARVTVRRILKNGMVAEFTAKEFWIENYAVKGGKEKSIAPNAMWLRRPRGQLGKCAAAQALRMAFPEVGAAPTAEEMEGKTIDGEFVTVAKAETIQQPTSKSGRAKPAAKTKASEAPAQEAENASDEAIGGEAAEDGAEPGEFLSKESMRKTLNVCLKRAGLELRHLQTEFPRIDDTNINAVLSYLSKLSANAD